MANLTREEMLGKLMRAAPRLIQVVETMDMGFEIAAIVHDGVINPEPGMLIGITGGGWPPLSWVGLSEDELQTSLADFLMNTELIVIPWAELSERDIEDWYAALLDLN
jgi:hypothetical protein